MAESADYDPGPWKGHDFKQARASYDADAGRGYANAARSGKKANDLIEPSVSTLCTGPLVVICDVTSSMQEWPATIFSKLPYLDHEVRDYLGPETEICFAAIGDAHKGSDYPLQVRSFAKGTELKSRLDELIREGKGGGGGDETYELAALYFATQCEMPNAVTPICIFIGDEHPYSEVYKTQAKKYVGITLEENTIPTAEVFAQLREKFSVYLVRKPYREIGEGKTSLEDEQNLKLWGELIGDDHIATLPAADRVVDVIFGILAHETGRVDDFKAEIEGRQEPGQVKTVYKSLATIHAIDAVRDKKALPKGGSRLHGATEGKSSTSLL